MIEQKDCTIIVPHLGSTKEQRYALNQCLTSLLETTTSKIILAINGGIRNLEAVEGLENERVELIVLQRQGQCAAVNSAVAITNTPWIFVTNDDMQYAPGWWEKLTYQIVTEKLPDNPEYGKNYLCISPKLIEPRPGAPTFEVYFCGGAGGDFDKQKWLAFAKNKHYPPEGMSITNPIRTGFNLPFLIKRELWDTIGGYDINYDPWGSNGDSDLEYKIRLAGAQPYQNINAVVYHFSQTSGTFSPDNRPFWDKNWHYFISKWGFERTSSPTIWQADFEIPMDKLKYKPWWKNFYAKP